MELVSTGVGPEPRVPAATAGPREPTADLMVQWQAVVPLSVYVLPATGTNCQS